MLPRGRRFLFRSCSRYRMQMQLLTIERECIITPILLFQLPLRITHFAPEVCSVLCNRRTNNHSCNRRWRTQSYLGALPILIPSCYASLR